MLKGTSVGLRSIEKNDLNQLLIWRNKPEFRQYFREYRELNMENQLQWYESRVINDNRTIMFSIENLTKRQLIGACGLCYIDWPNRNADFSIYVGIDDLYIDDYFAPDAASIMIRYAFEDLGLHRLWCEIYDFDIQKQKMLEKLGFQLEGRHKDTYWNGGHWNDSLFYSLIQINSF